MRCNECGYESDDTTEFAFHLFDCDAKPEEHWGSYVNLGEGLQPIPGKVSEHVEE